MLEKLFFRAAWGRVKKRHSQATFQVMKGVCAVVLAAALPAGAVPAFSAALIGPGLDSAHEGAPRFPLVVRQVPRVGNLRTAVRTNHQGDHIIGECRARLSGDTLKISFPMNEAYHLDFSFAVKNGAYSTALWWQPISGERVENTILTQELDLDKGQYAIGDVLYGYVKLSFASKTVSIELPGSRRQEVNARPEQVYTVEGPFSAFVRPEGFDPVADESLASYDYRAAMYELTYQRAHVSLVIEKNGEWCVTYDSDGAEGASDTYDAALNAVRRDFFKDHPEVVAAAGAAEEGAVTLREVSAYDEWPAGPKPYHFVTLWFWQKGENWEQIGFKKWEAPQ